ncbi:hypothetical protein NW752_010939 [Fusarium irregulare]|nr:hypothetical protein NW752_010939 [Fusarium irregulare]
MSQLPADLCNIPPELIPQSDEDRYVRSAHNERWEHLKPVIIKLYTCNYGKNNKSLKIPQMVSFMKTNYYFHAAENENPHKFREWGVSGRRLTKDMVDEIVGAIGRRPAAGMSTSRVTLKRGPGEEKLDMKRVKRHLSEGSSFTLPNTVQSGWYVISVLEYDP